MLATPLLSTPAELREQLPLVPAAARRVSRGRREIVDILNAADDRLLVIVGPCSIHDPVAAVEYARRLAMLSQQLEPDLCIVMRAYCEKPRTTVGWKGLLHDPRLDGSGAVEDGLVVTRELLLDLLNVGVPIACEFLDPMAAAFIEDVVSWGSIGARTSESPIHRQLASHLTMPVGFKNAMHGSVKVAVDAMLAAGHPHRFISLSERGTASVVTSRGNTDCHLVLRGGPWPNHDALAVAAATDALHAAGLPTRVVIDASHGNSGKDHRRQARVVRDVAEQVRAGADSIRGIMLESFLVAGRQEPAELAALTFGQSITDACIGWETTVLLLHELAAAVNARRAAAAADPTVIVHPVEILN